MSEEEKDEKQRIRLGRVHPVMIVVLGACGVLLMALPWLILPREMELPPVIEADSAAQRELLDVVARADAACARGDMDTVRALTTRAFWKRTAQLLREAGRAPEGESLQEQRFLIGDLGQHLFLHGRAEGERAVLVFGRGSARPARGYSANRSLLAVLFRWDGYGFLLDGKISRSIGASEHRRNVAEQLATEVLGAR